VQQRLFVRVIDGGIFVPASPEYLTTYVLLEQEDWFEKEIRYVRRFLLPGMRVIDVGASYGVYTLAMARAAAPGGSVWAFEPANGTLALLRDTVAANELKHVRVCPVALSNHDGEGFLDVRGNSELNNLVPVKTPSTEQVRTATLDAQHAAHAMGDIDFIKLDAEGEELRIIEGGQRFFSHQSPLVMFELKAGEGTNSELLPKFRELGYQIFRLIGPDTMLAPVDDDEPVDAFELNLFACKPGRAAHLAGRGLLVERPAPTSTRVPGSGVKYWKSLPFTAALPLPDVPLDHPTMVWADHYEVWRNARNSPAQRYAGLQAAQGIFTATADQSLINLAIHARVCLEAGARDLAVQIIKQLLARARQDADLGTGLLWSPSARFDAIPPVGSPRDWLIASAVHAIACEAQHSAYFAGAKLLPMLEWLQSTPYADAATERRRQLQAMRSGRQAGAIPCPLLTVAGPEHLNPQLWGG